MRRSLTLILAALAAQVSLDPLRVVAAASDPAYLTRIDRIREEAHGRGVTAIPTFFFGQASRPVVGCQPYHRLAQAAREAGAS